MSEIKVNKLSSRTGNAVTLGTSGDTFTIPAGVTLTNSGTATGFKSIDWQSAITADGSTATTAEAGKGYFIDNSSATHTINLPASPSIGDTVAIVSLGNASAYNITVGRNSSNIQGAAVNATLSTNLRATTLVYADATKGWIPVNDNTTNNYGEIYTEATGGTVTTSGNFKIHTFNSTSNFVASQVGNPAGGTAVVSYLVIAGGGGGGKAGNRAGGGGGGCYWRGTTGGSGGPGGGGNAAPGHPGTESPHGTGSAGGNGQGGGGGSGGTSGSGGSGLVIVRIPAAAVPDHPDLAVSPGTNTLSTDGPTGDKIAAFIVTGVLTI